MVRLEKVGGEVGNVGKVRGRWGYKDVGKGKCGGVEVDKVWGWWVGKISDFIQGWGTQGESKISPFLC